MVNHQIVSEMCGESWKLEPEEVKGQFTVWARTEKENHEIPHPGYKFTPVRGEKDEFIFIDDDE